MAERFFECEHQPGGEFVLRFRPPKIKMMPESTRQHVLAAGKETLLALRSLLDAAIEHIEQTEKDEKRGRTKIEVQ